MDNPRAPIYLDAGMLEEFDARAGRAWRAAMVVAGLAILLTVLGRFYHDAFRDFLARGAVPQATLKAAPRP